MTVAKFVVAVSIVVACSFVTPAQNDQRDLSEYKTGKVFDRKLDFMDATAKVLEGAQAYLWDAWSNKKKVKFNIYEYNREGDRVNLTLHVGPGPEGTWQVEEASVIDRCDDAGPMKRACRMNPVVTIYDRVEWEDRDVLVPPDPIKTNIKILVLRNSRSGARYELRRGALF